MHVHSCELVLSKENGWITYLVFIEDHCKYFDFCQICLHFNKVQI